MKVRILGSAAGGGLPQWNCACATCLAARAAGVNRDQDCLAVSGDGVSWYLVNASPDLRQQLIAAPELAPGPGRRDTPLRGVLLCTAELDHTIGLLSLREASSLSVYASAQAIEALSTAFPVRGVMAPYTTVDWRPVTAGKPVELAGGLVAEAFVVGDKRPRYAAATADRGGEWVLAYRIRDAARPDTGGLLYAPCLREMNDVFAAAAAEADCVILDGTFLYDDEMTRSAGAGPSATAMGHVPIEQSLTTLVRRPGVRYVYTHLNNTNPIAIEGSEEFQTVSTEGVRVARDGQVLEL